MGVCRISSVINIAIVVVVLLFAYYNLAKDSHAGFNYTIMLAVIAVAIVIVLVKIFWAQYRKK